MIVYLDESGDLGWAFDKPYRAGGSSRYLTIPFLITSNKSNIYPKRVIRKLYTKYGISPSTEKKGKDLSDGQRTYFVNQAINLLEKHPNIKISVITVNKENVYTHIRHDPNKLYNYMIGLALLDEICGEDEVTIIPDPRSIKVESGNSLLDYLQIKLWFEMRVKTTIKWHTIPSEKSLCLKFIDMVANIIWCKYEDGKEEHANQLLRYVNNKELFFQGPGQS